jgi:hypothetical protein
MRRLVLRAAMRAIRLVERRKSRWLAAELRAMADLYDPRPGGV